MFLSKRNNGIFYLWFEDNFGKVRKVSTRCKSQSHALDFLRKFQQSEKTTPLHENKMMLSQFVEDFLRFATMNYSKANCTVYLMSFNSFRPIIGDRRLSSITPRDVDHFKTERLRKISAVSVNIELRTLRAAFNAAIRWHVIDSNPFKNVALLPIPQKPPSYFSKESLAKLLAIIKESWLKDIVLFAVLTGMRRGEILNLRWQDVDLERRIIFVQSSQTFRTKFGKRRTVPMSDPAYDLIDKLQKGTSDYVFTLNGAKIFDGWVSHKFKQYVRKANLDDTKLHFHSLRHTFASWLVQDGVSLYEVKKLLGHSDIKTTETYSHLQPEGLHSTVNRIVLQPSGRI